MAAPVLMDDLIGEILLRVPPDEPAHRVKSSLVCKPWLCHLSDPTFLRRYREFYRTPPLLGFLYNLYIDVDFSDDDYCQDDISIGGFVPTTKASPLNPPAGSRLQQLEGRRLPPRPHPDPHYFLRVHRRTRRLGPHHRRPEAGAIARVSTRRRLSSGALRRRRLRA
jgi:hypothetical protein